MQKINYYISLTVIKAIALVLLVFIGLEFFILLAAQLGSLGKGSYTIGQALIYVLFLLPQQTYLLFPMAGLLGMLFGLSWLANHSELIIMRAAGVSPFQILKICLQTGIVIIILMTLLGEAAGPAGKSFAEKRKLVEISTEKALKTKQGLWLTQDQNFFYIKTIYSARHIAGISRYEFNQGRLISVSLAAEGFYRQSEWQMKDIKKSILTDSAVRTEIIPQAYWHLAIDPKLLKISQRLPDEMSLTQLGDFINYQRDNHLTGSVNQLAFWQRIFQPLACLVMMLLAVPFIFGPLRTAATSLRLVLGVIIGFAFYLFNQLFPPLSQVFNFSPVLAALLPSLIFGLFGFILMKKVY